MNAFKHAVRQVLDEMVQVQCYLAGSGGGLPPEVDSAGRVAAAMRLGGQIVEINDLGSGDAGETAKGGA